MKIIFDRDTLIAAVAPLMGAVSSKNTIAAIEGILMETKGDNTCVLSSYDLEKGMRAVVEARVIDSGSFIVNANKFNQIIRTMPEGELTMEVNDHNVIKITGGRSSFELHAMKGSDFPNLPDLNIDSGIRLKQGDLKNMLVCTAFAVAQNDSRPALNGSLFQIEKDKLTVVSCDGNRLALKEKKCEIQTIAMEEKDLSMRFIVPGKSLVELVKLLDAPEETVSMKVTRKHMILATEHICLFTRLIEEEYVDYERFIPKTSKIFVRISCGEFIRSLERASLVTEDRTMGQTKSPLICQFTDGLLKIKSTSVSGSVYDEICIEKQGEDLDIAFNCKYLLDALRSCDCEKIRLSMTTSLMSMIIEPDGEDSSDSDGTFLFLVLPVRMKE